MKKILIPILILLISCSDKKSEPKKTATELDKNWTDFSTKDSIPELLTLTLKKVLNDDFKIANPNEEFNRTDVIINDSAPRRQLRLLSRKNSLWRITYVQGGIGEHYVYAECKITNDSISDFKISQSLLRLENNDSIDKYLADKKLEPKKVKIIMK
ncbi:MAG: hypothetical protein R3342_11370 [Lutibacter sp.]|uniref:hypothetical protein n=1 Tax=Lutibacter sp. TaxID=1925666 RepID=UPI00299D8EF6|nr:hypothetical protein [Lutibacter sp.]MDX1830134.1 hypothetical protein [Lutibacter sp.]